MILFAIVFTKLSSKTGFKVNLGTNELRQLDLIQLPSLNILHCYIVQW